MTVLSVLQDRHPNGRNLTSRNLSAKHQICRRVAPAPEVPQGGLKDIMNMPVDIFHEICCYLSPLDLRQLSLSNRSLRGILMSREAKPMWKAARTQFTHLPDCPPDISEPQYARFIFTSECYDCEEEGIRASFYYRVRYCKTCRRKNAIAPQDLVNSFIGFPEQILSRLPYLYPSSKRPVFHLPTVELIYRGYLALSLSNAALGDDLLASFTEEWVARLTTMTETGREIRKGMKQQLFTNDCRRTTLHEKRMASIRQHFVDLGYEPADLPTFHVDWPLSARSQECELTEQEWELLRPKLEPIVQQWRQDRLNAEAAQRLQHRKADLTAAFTNLRTSTALTHHLQAYPPTDLLWNIPIVATIVQRDTDGLTPGAWKRAELDALQFVQTWRADVLRRLHDVLKGRASTVEAMAEELASTASAFFCTTCRSHYWYPEVIDHCLRHGGDGKPDFSSLVIW